MSRQTAKLVKLAAICAVTVLMLFGMWLETKAERDNAAGQDFHRTCGHVGRGNADCLVAREDQRMAEREKER